jgi:hypothetical protein
VSNLNCLLVLVLLVSCSSPTNPNNPNDPNNPYAALGCSEAPRFDVSQPKEIFDIELGKPYELQGGAFRLFFDLDTPSKVRVTLTGIKSYDSLYVLVGDLIDFRRSGGFTHDAGSASNEDGPPLTEASVESKEALEITVSVTLNRFLSDQTQRTDEGKRLFCERYTVVVEKIS